MKITQIIPKLPFQNRDETKSFYKKLGFDVVNDYDQYFIMEKDDAEIHFFEFPDLEPKKSNFMIYLRVNQDINAYYLNLQQESGIEIHPNGKLELKPWQQREFSILDPNGTLLTFGEPIN